MKSFIIKLCCCLNPNRNNNETLIEKTESISKRIRKSRNASISNTPLKELKTDDSSIKASDSPLSPISTHCLFPLSQYRPNEYSLIQYTEDSIVSFINKEFLSTNEYKEFHNKDNLILSIKEKGNLFTDEFPMIKMTYSLPRSLFVFPSLTIDKFVSYINEREKRLKWDKSLKDYKVVEGSQMKAYILHSWLNSPMLFVSERDFVEKKVDFFHQETFYSFYSSVSEEYIPRIKNVERLVNYFNGYKITADDKNFYVSSLSQMDLKMKLPQAMVNMAMSTRLREWYGCLIKAINEDMKSDQMNIKTPNETGHKI